MTIHKDDILRQVKSYNILNRYLEKYSGKSRLMAGQNFSNPFLAKKQETPSFNIYVNPSNNEWRYKDFATDDEGSCFDLVMKLFSLSFQEALAKINVDFNLNLLEESNLATTNFGASSITTHDFNQSELSFWTKYGITSTTLLKYNVVAISSFKFISKKDKPCTINKPADQFFFGYLAPNSVKIYKPLSPQKEYKFQHIGEKEYNAIFGWDQLPPSGAKLFITGGEKDVMALDAKGFNAISLNSESAKIAFEKMDELKSRFTAIYVLYDNDATGIKFSNKLVLEHNLYNLSLPPIPNNGKDIADYYANGGLPENDMPAKGSLDSSQIDLSSDNPIKTQNTVQNLPEFAKVAKSATMQNEETTNTAKDDDLEDFLKTTPTIPSEVFELLPELLKSGCSAFDDVRKRDVFFTGAIAILSGCLPKVTGVYHQERVYTHLYTFIIAPPASGKGVLKNAKRLADQFHQRVLEHSRESQRKFEAELMEHKSLIKKIKKGDTPPEPPAKPPFKIVFIPADSSHARMIEHLQMNEGQGIICETEADSMSGAKKQDWGDYSPALRASFHHEKITLTRKTNNEYIEINEPRIAVALSGTPAQAPRLISSAEDGLFSRFLFYAFKNNLEWQDPSPIGKTMVYNDHFDKLSSQVLDLVDFLSHSPTEIQLTESQWGILNTTFTAILSEVTIYTSEAASGVVYRLGLILYRICMIFTALRKFENAELVNVYICSDNDFEIALKVVKTYLSHSILMFNNLPEQGENIVFQGGDNKRKLYDSLPDQFTRKEAIAHGQKFNLSARSVDELLRMGLGHTLTKLKAGLYQKA